MRKKTKEELQSLRAKKMWSKFPKAERSRRMSDLAKKKNASMTKAERTAHAQMMATKKYAK